MLTLVLSGCAATCVETDLQRPPDITLYGVKESIPSGTDMTICVSTEPSLSCGEVFLYEWYLNGFQLAGETEDTIRIGFGLERGHYRLDVAVSFEEIVSSSYCEFTVY